MKSCIRQASYTVIATALERFKLLLFGNIGILKILLIPSSSRTGSGRPRVSGPKIKKSPRLNSMAVNDVLALVLMPNNRLPSVDFLNSSHPS